MVSVACTFNYVLYLDLCDLDLSTSSSFRLSVVFDIGIGHSSAHTGGGSLAAWCGGTLGSADLAANCMQGPNS